MLIEKNVPITGRSYGIRTEKKICKEIFDKFNVGDSAEFEGILAKVLVTYFKRIPNNTMRIITRKQENGSIRVWRTA